MENNIELFDNYIDGSLSAAEKQAFESRLASEKDFAADFRVYLFALKGIYQEAEQDNIEFGHAMKNLSADELRRIVGRRPHVRPFSRMRERMAWAATVAAVFVTGLFAVFDVRRSGNDRVDDIIVAYNDFPGEPRCASAAPVGSDIPSLEKAYRDAPADDVQACQHAGMRLTIAYLKAHDRKKARELLTEMAGRFAGDERFVGWCNKILDQLE